MQELELIWLQFRAHWCWTGKAGASNLSIPQSVRHISPEICKAISWGEEPKAKGS